MIKNYKHIIWDWNGTLLDDVELSLNIINKILTERNIKSLSLNEYRDIFTFPVQDYYEKAGLDFNKYPFAELGKEWIDEYEKHKLKCKLHDGVEKMLKMIVEKTEGQSILSAYSQYTLEEIVKYFKLENYFSHMVGLDHIYATSKVELGHMLMKKLGNGKGEVLLIGDTIHDYETAREIGADCILIANGHQSKDRLLSCGVKVFNNLNEMLYRYEINP